MLGKVSPLENCASDQLHYNQVLRVLETAQPNAFDHLEVPNLRRLPLNLGTTSSPISTKVPPSEECDAELNAYEVWPAVLSHNSDTK